MVIANWKLNGDPVLCKEFAAGAARWSMMPVDVVVCPPAVYLASLSSALTVGAQNVAAASSGAYTGEISAAMLESVACRYCIVGHSERRAEFGDTDEIVAEKIQRLLEQGVTAVLCVGESLAQREAEQAEAVVKRQLESALSTLSASDFTHIVVAYEPIWAIGTGRTASPEQAEAMHASIRACIASFQPSVADSLRILYGGSVKPANAQGLFEQPNIDGALVGGASLVLDDFVAICHAAGE
ncbi:triose-phosphate isomerase [bacterium]|nr:triose-phosphate isomerase [bacterium]